MTSNSGEYNTAFLRGGLSPWPIFRVVLLQRDEGTYPHSSEQKECFSVKNRNPFLPISRDCFPAPCPHSCSHECKKALFWPPSETKVGSTYWAWGGICNSICSSWIIQEGRKRRFVFPLNLATCMPPRGQRIELKLKTVASACNTEKQKYTLANIHWHNAT